MNKTFPTGALKYVALGSAILLALFLIIYSISFAATFTFIQTQWSVAVPGSSATLPQSNWSEYDLKDSNITTPGVTDVSMNLPIGSFVEDNYLIGVGQVFSSTTIAGTGNASRVQLSTVVSNDPDLIVGSYDGGLSYYRNDNPLNANGWIATSIPTLDAVDIGVLSKPTLGDIDGDGDLDMIVGENDGTLNFFRNIGGTPIPSFQSEPIGNLGSALTNLDVGSNSSPTFADIDGDGDLDLIIGRSSGRFVFVANEGSPTAPNFSSASIDNWSGINVGSNAKPGLTDINGDNVLDLVIGDSNGDINLYLNSGTVTAPIFLQSSRVQNWLLPDFGSGVNMAPSFVDFDGDGDMDLVLGMGNGTPSQTRWYVRGPNTGAPNYGYQTNTIFTKLMYKFDGTALRDIGPTFGDLDKDTFFAPSGTYTSGILYVGQQSTFTTASYITGGTGTVSLQIRAGDSSDGTGSTWSSWTSIPVGGGNISSITSSTPRQYVQYKAMLSTSDVSVTPTLESVTINYRYVSTQTLTSSKFDTGITDVRLTQLTWNQSAPVGTSVSVSLRSAGTLAGITTAPWYDFSTSSAISSGSALGDGVGDRFFQYKISLTSNGTVAPIVNDVSVVYAQNSAPQFNTSFPSAGGSGVVATQNPTGGTVAIQYSVRDTDNTSITPSFEYSLNGGVAWSAIPALYLGASDLFPKTVSGTYQTFSALWNAKGQIPNTFTSNMRVRVTVSDGEAYNSIASAMSASSVLDTKNPVITSFVLDSRVDQLVIAATDDSSPKMRLSNTGSFSGSPITIASPYNWTPPVSETVYIEVSDSYGNNLTTSAKAPSAPTGVTITDVSQPGSSIWSERINWDVYVPVSGAAFGSYQIYRSTDGITFSSLGVSLTDINNTSYTNGNLNSGTVYYYRVVVVDADGDTSNYSSTVYDQPDGGTKVEFTSSAASSVEGNSGSTTITVPVRLSGVSSAPVTVNYQIDSIDAGTATAGSDYAFTPGSLTFPAGSAASQSFTFSVLGDTGYEQDETIRISLVSPSGAIIGTNVTYTHTITNDDVAPTVSFTSASSNITEGGSAVATITLSTLSNTTTTILFTIGGSATNVSDYSIAQISPITIPIGSTSAVITVQTLTDALYEGNETVLLTLGAPIGATLGTPSAHIVTIQDANIQPSLSINDATVVEGSSGTIPAPFAITLSGASASTVTVAYSTQNGTATAPSDYVAASGTIVFAPGETSKNISILVNGDTTFEPNETFTVVLSGPVGATLAAKSTGIGTIQNDDILPVAQFSSVSSNGLESVTSVTIPVTLSATAGQAVTIDYAVTGGTATQGTDYNLSAGTLTIPVGASSASIALTVINDTAFEADETIIISLSNPTNATLGSPTSHTYTITNDDLDVASVSFATAASSVSESNPTASLSVQLSKVLTESATINYSVTGGSAQSGSDFTLSAGTLTFGLGETSKSISISIIDDVTHEIDETIIISLSNPSVNLNIVSPSDHTITITDNDPLPTFSIGNSQSTEGNSGTKAFIFNVSLSGSGSDTSAVSYATLNGTASAPSDYASISGTLTFASGETNKTISVSVVGDAVYEGDETFSVVLSSPVNANITSGIGLGTILDDDTQPIISFSAASSTAMESVLNISIPLSISVPSGIPITVTYTVGGSAVSGSDHSLSGGTFIIPSGVVTYALPLIIIDDTNVESSETVVVTLTDISSGGMLGAEKTYTHTIQDDDSFIQGGITISDVGSTEATIIWLTSEPSTSIVEYGTESGVYALSKVDPIFVTTHQVLLTGLTKNTTYYLRAKSLNFANEESIDDNGGAGYLLTTSDGPIITSIVVSNTTDTTTDISWETDEPSDAFITYSKDPLLAGAVTAGDPTINVAGSPFTHTFTLTNLDPASTYYFKVASTDADGNVGEDTNNGLYRTFLTTSDMTPPVISSITTPIVTSDLAVIFWQTNELSSSKIEYGLTSGVYTAQTALNTTLSLNHSGTVLNLSPLSRYYYRVISADAGGNNAISSEQVINTPEAGPVIIQQITQEIGVALEIYNNLLNQFNLAEREIEQLRVEKDTKPPVITDIVVSNIGAFEATISWKTDEDSTSFVEYGTSTKYGFTVGIPAYTEEHVVKLSRLKMGTPYHYRVISADRSSNQASSTDAIFETIFSSEALEGAIEVGDIEQFRDNIGELIPSITPNVEPPVVADVTVSSITKNSAVVTWRTNVDATSVVGLATDAEYAPTGDAPYKIEVGGSSGRVKNHRVELANLQPGTRYHIQARSQNVVDVFGKSSDVTFTTAFTKPALSTVEFKEREATFEWTTEALTTSYLEYRNEVTSQIKRNGSELKTRTHRITITELTPGTRYTIRGLGTDERGNIIETEVKNVTTPFDSDSPVISDIKIENALVPGRNDRLQTIISWKTNEPSTSQVLYEEGVGTSPTLTKKTLLQEPLITEHLVVIGIFKPAQVYRIQVVSTDREGNTSTSDIQSFLTPQQAESIFDILTKNFQQSFGWLKF